MNEVTRILSALGQGDPQAASQLLPLVYDELHQLAAHRLAHQTPGQTLQPTALVHEAYLRLVGDAGGHDWDSRSNFAVRAARSRSSAANGCWPSGCRRMWRPSVASGGTKRRRQRGRSHRPSSWLGAPGSRS
jgi:hypothetical protein